MERVLRGKVGAASVWEGGFMALLESRHGAPPLSSAADCCGVTLAFGFYSPTGVGRGGT